MKNKLPTLVSPIAPDLRQFLNRMREAFESPEGLLTRDDLVGTGVFQTNTTGGLDFLEPGEAQSCIAPPAALNLVASGAMTSIILTWDNEPYASTPCYAYAEVWRASADNLSLSVLIGTTSSSIYADAVGSDASNYYWIRFVNVLNDKGPFVTSGVAGATSPDVAYLLSQLATSITNSELASTLAASINSTFHENEAPTAKADGTTLVAGDVWIDANGNDAVSIYNGSAWVSAAVATQAYVGNEITQQVGYCERTVTEGGAKNVATAYTTKATCEAASVSGETFAWKDDTALAGEVKTVSTTAAGNTTTVSQHTSSISGIEGKHTVKIDNNGYVTGYGLISTANNGSPTSEFAIVADQFSIAPVNTSNTATDGSPFFHRTSSTVINGATIPAGTYMKGAFIHDATITTAKIGNAAVDTLQVADAAIKEAKIDNLAVTTAKIDDLSVTDAKITALNATKIDAGTIQAARIGAGTIDSTKLVVKSVVPMIDQLWKYSLPYNARLVAQSAYTSPVLNGSWFLSSDSETKWIGHVTSELAVSTWAAVKCIVAFRSDEDSTSHEAMQAALQVRTDSVSTTTGATQSGYTTSAMTSFPATSTSAFPDQGTIVFLDARGTFTYTSKTATSFIGASQNVGVTSWSSAATINLRSDHYLGIYFSESCWARYSVKYTRRTTTNDYIACSVDLIDSIGAPTSISGGSNSNPATNSNSGMTLNTVLIQFSDYIPENYAAAINRNTTTIDGGKITTGTITAAQVNLTPGDVQAGTAATDGSRMNITSDKIEIHEGTGSNSLRVKLGAL